MAGGVVSSFAAATTDLYYDYAVEAWRTEGRRSRNSVTSMAQAPGSRVWLRDHEGGLQVLQSWRLVPMPVSRGAGSGPLSRFGFDREGNLRTVLGQRLDQYEAGAVLNLAVLPPWWKTWWLGALALVGTTVSLYWILKTRLHRVNRVQAAQRALTRRMIETQEAERKRIASELHDSLGQDLLVIKNRAMLGLQDSAATAKSIEQFGEISRLASASLAEVREISHNLRPYQLDRLGLTKALQAMVTRVAGASGLRCTARIDSLDGAVPATMQIHCYRIVQELLNNIVKHSHASKARVLVGLGNSVVHVVVEDDGCGFDPVAAANGRTGPRGMGLEDIAERVRILRGTLQCESERARGTRWEIAIPAAEKPSHEPHPGR